MQWLLGLTIFSSLWVAIVTNNVPVSLSAAVTEVVFASPIYLLITFACYSLAVVGYRVTTFNDCIEASAELKAQIEQARQDLTRKGFNFE